MRRVDPHIPDHEEPTVFSGLLLAEFSTMGRQKTYEKGETLFLESDPGDFIILLNEGLVEISVTSLAGRKSILAHCGPGEVIGEISVLDGKPRSADATALRPLKARIIRQSEVLSCLANNPKATQEVMIALCSRIRNASGMFATQALTSAQARLARSLLQLESKWGEPHGDRIRLREEFSQSELGAFSGLARENVNRHIQRWCAEDIVAINNCVIDILDRDRLIEIAEL